MAWKTLSILGIALPFCTALGQPVGTTGGDLEKDALKEELKAGDADKARSSGRKIMRVTVRTSSSCARDFWS